MSGGRATEGKVSRDGLEYRSTSRSERPPVASAARNSAAIVSSLETERRRRYPPDPRAWPGARGGIDVAGPPISTELSDACDVTNGRAVDARTSATSLSVSTAGAASKSARRRSQNRE